jgi:hypothetical protein
MRLEAFVPVTLAFALAGCQSAPPGASERAPTTAAVPAAAGDAPAHAAAVPIDWSGAGDCLGQLRLLFAAAAQGRVDESQEPPFAVLSGAPAGGLEWIAAPTVPIVADLPLRSYADRGAAAAAASCLLVVEPARDLRAAHRVVDFEDVASVYQSSVRSERNPDYDAAQARLRDAERESKPGGPSILRVGDPLLDLIGLLAGGVIATFGHVTDDDVGEALAELKATPRSRERPVYRAYEFQRSTVRAGKEATIPVALRDVRRGFVWHAELRQREMREFAVLEGLDPRDPDYEQHRAGAFSWAEFENWQQQPPQLPLSALVAALVEPEGAAGGPPRAEPELMADATPAVSAIGSTDAGLSGRNEPEELPSTLAIEPTAGPGRGTAGRHSDLRSDAAIPADAALPAPDVGGDAPIDRRIDPAPMAAGSDPRVASVVRLAAGGRSGNGFYVRPRLVVTAADVVGTGPVIDVTTNAGESMLGLVVLTDPARNLALVHVPRAGQPTPFAGGEAPGPGRTVQVIELGSDGRPRVASAVLGDAAAGLEPARRLELETGGGAPAAGAPVFLGDRAVGLVAEAFGGPSRNAIPIDGLAELLASESLAALR